MTEHRQPPSRRIASALRWVDLKGAWLCPRHELPQMEAQGGGVIVNIGSVAGLAGLPISVT